MGAPRSYNFGGSAPKRIKLIFSIKSSFLGNCDTCLIASKSGKLIFTCLKISHISSCCGPRFVTTFFDGHNNASG
ncbi:hypothetical protein HanXRQr2_Chr13g0593041 [Helianthus annuus]|uniref:Uncharacterized protein n=1 Tax=Helianthus annuus TaxID=4232 RepID=A0A9K3EHU8_HELAN|nr:hypothetical protein HanXRQr2_Chr13g0593041 [Helianthus annuus]